MVRLRWRRETRNRWLETAKVGIMEEKKEGGRERREEEG